MADYAVKASPEANSLSVSSSTVDAAPIEESATLVTEPPKTTGVLWPPR